MSYSRPRGLRPPGRGRRTARGARARRAAHLGGGGRRGARARRAAHRRAARHLAGGGAAGRPRALHGRGRAGSGRRRRPRPARPLPATGPLTSATSRLLVLAVPDAHGLSGVLGRLPAGDRVLVAGLQPAPGRARTIPLLDLGGPPGLATSVSTRRDGLG